MQHVLLTLLIPGYRALRHGDRRRAFIFQAAFVALFALALLTPWLASPGGAVLFAVLFLGLSVCASRRGPAAGEPVRLRAWEWAWLTVPQLLIAILVASPSLRRPLSGLEVFQTPTSSNAPTLRPGDRFVVTCRDRAAVRGRMVVFHAPGTGRHYIKRVVGVDGDVVAGGPDGVTVNGHVIRAEPVAAFGPLTVPEGHAFVVGDNLANSRDSRHFGAIQKEAITGRPLYVLWSDEWRRIGTKLR